MPRTLKRKWDIFIVQTGSVWGNWRTRSKPTPHSKRSRGRCESHLVAVKQQVLTTEPLCGPTDIWQQTLLWCCTPLPLAAGVLLYGMSIIKKKAASKPAAKAMAWSTSFHKLREIVVSASWARNSLMCACKESTMAASTVGSCSNIMDSSRCLP